MFLLFFWMEKRSKENEEIRRLIENVDDPETLREVIYHYSRERSFLEDLLEKTLQERAKEAQQKLMFKDHLKVLRKILFGKSSEKRKKEKEASDRPRSIEKRALLLHGQSLAPAPKEEETKDLAEEVIYYELSEQEKKKKRRFEEF